MSHQYGNRRPCGQNIRVATHNVLSAPFEKAPLTENKLFSVADYIFSNSRSSIEIQLLMIDLTYRVLSLYAYQAFGICYTRCTTHTRK